MNYEDYKKRLDDIVYACGINTRYHHTLEWRYGIAERALKIIVGLLTGAGLIWAVPNWGYPIIGLWLAILSFAFAVALNAIPVGEKEKSHGEMFRLWSELRKDSLLEEQKTCHADDSRPVGFDRLDRLNDLTAKAESLNALESAPWRDLLLKCQYDENESRWGKGVRTPEQVERERRLQECGAMTPVSASPVSPGWAAAARMTAPAAAAEAANGGGP